MKYMLSVKRGLPERCPQVDMDISQIVCRAQLGKDPPPKPTENPDFCFPFPQGLPMP